MAGFGSVCLIYVTATMALNAFCHLLITFHQVVGKAQRALTVLICSVSIKILMMVTMARAWQEKGILWSFIVGDILVFLFVVSYSLYHIRQPRRQCK